MSVYEGSAIESPSLLLKVFVSIIDASHAGDHVAQATLGNVGVDASTAH